MRKILFVLLVSLATATLAACGGSNAPSEQTQEVQLGTIQLNSHPTDLSGKTVLLRWNGKPNGDKLLESVAELLVDQFRDVEIVKLWEVDPDSAVSSDSLETSDKIAKTISAQNPDIVVASQCD